MTDATGELSHPGLLGRVLGWMGARMDAADDLSLLSAVELRQIASDLSLTELDLVSLSAGAENAVLMERMLRAHGIDPQQMRYGFATLLHDMNRVCTQFKRTGQCRRELDAGSATAHCRDYCPNAATIEDLVNSPGVPRFP